MGAMRIERISAETEFDWEKKRATLIQMAHEYPKLVKITDSSTSRLTVSIVGSLSLTLDRPPLSK